MALVLAASILAVDADFGWPDSITAGAHEAAELPDPQRLRTLERLTPAPGTARCPSRCPARRSRSQHPPVRGATPGPRRLARGHRGGHALDIDAQRPTRRPPVRAGRVAGGSHADGPGAGGNRTRPPRPGCGGARLGAGHAGAARCDAVASLGADGARGRQPRGAAAGGPAARGQAGRPHRAAVAFARRGRRPAGPVEAIRALGSHPRATPALLRLLAEPGDDLRAAALDALAALRAEAAIPGSSRWRAAARRTRRSAGHSSRWARWRRRASVTALIALLRTPPVSAETRAALRAAGAAAVPGLIRELESGTPGSATIAAAILGTSATGAPACRCARRWSGARSRDGGAGRVARIGDPAAVPALVPRVRVERPRDAPARVRRAADLPRSRATVTLARGLADADPHVRELSARLAAAVGSQPSALAIAPLLADGEREVRRAAASALAAIAPRSSALVASILGAISKPGDPAATTTNGRRSGRRSSEPPRPRTPAGSGPPGRARPRRPRRDQRWRARSAPRRRDGRSPTQPCCSSSSTPCRGRTAPDCGGRRPGDERRRRPRRASRCPPLRGRRAGGPRAPVRRNREDARRWTVARRADPGARRDHRGPRRGGLGGPDLHDGDTRDALGRPPATTTRTWPRTRARRSRERGRPPGPGGDLGRRRGCARATARRWRGAGSRSTSRTRATSGR